MNTTGKDTFIFIGASGSGKGTQVSLLKQYINKKDPETPIFHMQTGEHFREFIKGESYAAEIARGVQEHGGLQPSFLAMWIWSDLFVKNLTGKEHLILDGAPRTLSEAHHLDIALKFFKREQPVVIYLKVHREWSFNHLMERSKIEGRKDDTPESINRRLNWFDHDVLPAINHYRRDRDYDFIEINGENSIEQVHREIIANVYGE
jgi:adenylate kinase